LPAESVADVTERPLYTISSGELGVGAGEVEGNLNIALRLATTWNAIILIDEADVFLEQRSAHDLERNSLVSSKSPVLIVIESPLTTFHSLSSSS
jgi:hypothetical protein